MFAVKGLWNERPSDWPTDVTYKDPNNGEKISKIRKMVYHVEFLKFMSFVCFVVKRLSNRGTRFESFPCS